MRDRLGPLAPLSPRTGRLQVAMIFCRCILEILMGAAQTEAFCTAPVSFRVSVKAPHFADSMRRRESLVGLLWPDCPKQVARHNLWQALFNLRLASAQGDGFSAEVVARVLDGDEAEAEYTRKRKQQIG